MSKDKSGRVLLYPLDSRVAGSRRFAEKGRAMLETASLLDVLGLRNVRALSKALACWSWSESERAKRTDPKSKSITARQSAAESELLPSSSENRHKAARSCI